MRQYTHGNGEGSGGGGLGFVESFDEKCCDQSLAQKLFNFFAGIRLLADPSPDHLSSKYLSTTGHSHALLIAAHCNAQTRPQLNM